MRERRVRAIHRETKPVVARGARMLHQFYEQSCTHTLTAHGRNDGDRQLWNIRRDEAVAHVLRREKARPRCSNGTLAARRCDDRLIARAAPSLQVLAKRGQTERMLFSESTN